MQIFAYTYSILVHIYIVLLYPFCAIEHFNNKIALTQIDIFQ